MKNKKNPRKNKEKLILYIVFVSFLLKISNFLFKKKNRQAIKDNFKRFENEEIKELQELEEKKENIEKFWHDSFGIFKDYFIPNKKNKYKPKIIYPKTLVSIAFFLFLFKVLLVSYLFFINPFKAWMSDVITDKVAELINQERRMVLAPELTLNKALSLSALEKANDMIEKGYFAHYSPDGRKPWDFIDRNDYPYIFVGENLAMNFTSAASAHKALMDSPSHKENIINSRYTEYGLAMATGVINGRETNVLVELFAARQKSAPQPDDDQEILQSAPASAGIKADPEQIPREPEIAESPLSGELSQEAGVSKKKTSIAGVESQFISENNTKKAPEPLPDAFDANMDNKEPLPAPNHDQPRLAFVSSIIRSLNYVFAAVLVLMILALSANIIIKIRVQHKPAIIQTLILLLFIAGLVYWRLDLSSYSITEILLI